MKIYRKQVMCMAVMMCLASMLTGLWGCTRMADPETVIAPVRSEDGGKVSMMTAEAADLRPGYNSGNCRRLAGKPFVMVIYLDDDVSSWTEEEVGSYTENLIYPALDFLEDNAAKWDVSLNLKTGYYATYGHPDRPVKYDGVIDPFEDGNISRDILDQAALSLGFDSKEDMHDNLTEFAGTDQIAYVVMVDKGGRSYSLPYQGRNRGVSSDYQLEYAVIFSGFTDTSRDSASDTIAHELLHLFGAEDFYYPASREALAEEYYPTDIMLCAMPDLPYFTLGAYTAYTLGWTDTVAEVCAEPGWWG